MKLTIQEVAQAAGVGVGTVSRVLNHHKSVRPETRERVERAMQELGFTPNPHARRVAGGKSYTVSIILQVVGTDFYIRLLNGLESTLEAHRYDSALFPLLGRERLERYLNSNTLAYLSDGIVMASHNLGDLYPDGRLPTRQPVVIVDGFNPHYDSVYLDNRLGGELAAQALARLPGEIMAISVHQALDEAFKTSIFADRMNGFYNALEEMGRPVPLEQRRTVTFNLENARTAARDLLERATLPVNIFAAADLIALGVLEETRALGLEVGRDVRVIGFDDHPWSAERGLSTLHQPVEAMGAAAAELLVERLSGFKGEPRTVRFEPRLVERSSTRTI
jgi:DNA-binding LacI/PurR family transcriptional regulator